jgi:hypothetical protein
MRQVRVLGFSLLSAAMAATGAFGAEDCRSYAPSPAEFVEDVASSDLLFVGTVRAFRLDDTTLADEVPHCPLRGSVDASDECKAFWRHVVTVQFSVEVNIEGAERQGTFEKVVFGRDPCMQFDIGQRWIVFAQHTMHVQLAEMPAADVIAGLRRQAAKDD